MTSFPDALWQHADRLLCCWPQSFRIVTLCCCLAGAFPALSCNLQDEPQQLDVHLEAQSALQVQEWALGSLAPFPGSTANCCWPCTSFCASLLRVGWGCDSPASQMCCVCEKHKSHCSAVCGWSQVDASHRYLGEIGQMGARFNLKVSFQERSWEEDFGCLCDWCCWQSSYSSVLTLKGSFSKKMVEMSALIIPLTSCIFPYNPNLFITRHSTVLILRGHVLDCLKQLSFFLPAYWSRCTWYNTIIIKVTEQKYSKIAVRPLQCALIVQNTEWELEKKVMEKRKDSFSWHEREQIVSVESKGQLVLLLARKVSSSLYQREGLAGSGSTLLST